MREVLDDFSLVDRKDVLGELLVEIANDKA
jgi:hypothetical protein